MTNGLPSGRRTEDNQRDQRDIGSSRTSVKTFSDQSRRSSGSTAGATPGMLRTCFKLWKTFFKLWNLKMKTF